MKGYFSPHKWAPIETIRFTHFQHEFNYIKLNFIASCHNIIPISTLRLKKN